MASSIFTSIFRRAPQVPASSPSFPYKIEENPYQCKRTWPPDFSKLSEKHQFRLERRYRRRTKLKWARPNWTKAVKLAQWGTIVFVLGYGVLFMEFDQGQTPFDGIRKWYQEQTGSLSNSRRGSSTEKPGSVNNTQPS